MQSRTRTSLEKFCFWKTRAARLLVSRCFGWGRVALLAERIISGKDDAVLQSRQELNLGRRLLEMDLLFEKSRISI